MESVDDKLVFRTARGAYAIFPAIFSPVFIVLGFVVHGIADAREPIILALCLLVVLILIELFLYQVVELSDTRISVQRSPPYAWALASVHFQDIAKIVLDNPITIEERESGQKIKIYWASLSRTDQRELVDRLVDVKERLPTSMK